MAILSREFLLREKRAKCRTIAPPPEVQPLKFPKCASGYELRCPIGYGAFAVVHKARCKLEDGKTEDVAIKMIDLEGCSDSTFEELRREMSAMRQSRHKNILNFHVAFQSDAKIWLVMPIATAGSAADVMRCQPEKRFQDERIIAYILGEICKAMDYFHGERQMHRDLKAGNVLVQQDASVCLADFGVATPYSFENRHSTFVGTPCWMAPEVLAHRQYDEKADVWSFGITAMELLRGEAPYQRLQPLKVMRNIIENDPPHLHNSECSGGLYLLVDFCLKKDPKDRPSMNTCAKSKYFHKGDKHKLAELLLRTPDLENRQVQAPLHHQSVLKFGSDGTRSAVPTAPPSGSECTACDTITEDWDFSEEDDFGDLPEAES